MSIILEGIDLPEKNTRVICLFPNGAEELVVLDADSGATAGRPIQAIQIPKGHGRLIDVDELKEKRETMCWKDEYYMTHESDFIDSRHIDNAPTILEAET